MLHHPVALVTGGSRGIGQGICIQLARAGYAVAINYQDNETGARQTQSLLPAGIPSLLCQADVSRAAERERLLAAVLSQWARIDLLVNNAGITSVGRRDILEATEESWDAVLGVNLKGPFFLSQLAANAMLRTLAANAIALASASGSAIAAYRPCIINISSVSAYALSTNRADYCISKAGLGMATQLFALRLADQGVRVYEVRPGIIESDMTAGAREQYTKLIAEGLTPIRRWGTPEDVGQAVAALAQGALPYSTGEVINIDGGFHLRAFPSAARLTTPAT